MKPPKPSAAITRPWHPIVVTLIVLLFSVAGATPVPTTNPKTTPSTPCDPSTQLCDCQNFEQYWPNGVPIVERCYVNGTCCPLGGCCPAPTMCYAPKERFRPGKHTCMMSDSRGTIGSPTSILLLFICVFCLGIMVTGVLLSRRYQRQQQARRDRFGIDPLGDPQEEREIQRQAMVREFEMQQDRMWEESDRGDDIDVSMPPPVYQTARRGNQDHGTGRASAPSLPMPSSSSLLPAPNLATLSEEEQLQLALAVSQHDSDVGSSERRVEGAPSAPVATDVDVASDGGTFARIT